MHLNLKIIGTYEAANLSKRSTSGYSLQDPKRLIQREKRKNFFPNCQYFKKEKRLNRLNLLHKGSNFDVEKQI